MIDTTFADLHINRQGQGWHQAAPEELARAWPTTPSSATRSRCPVAEVRPVKRADRSANAISALLPRGLPHVHGWQIEARYRPAEQVGGDFYDIVPLANGRIGVLIGDVAGKGMAAAILMAMARTILRAEAASGDAPAQVLRRANEQITASMPAGHFLTCFYAVLDPATGHTHMANAGHNLPFLSRGGVVSEIDLIGFPLGLMEGIIYDEITIVLEQRDSLLLYSDGITEARNPARELFGVGRLREVLVETLAGSGAAALDAVIGQVDAFVGPDARPEDDIAMLLLRRDQAS